MLLSIILAIVLLSISLLTSVGNLIVLLAFYFDRKLRTINDYFILNMSIADFFVGFICIPFYIPYSLTNVWPFGRLFCKIWLTIDDVSTMSSVINIVCITINRYWSIAYPISYRKTVRHSSISFVLFGIWFVSFLNFSPGIWLLNFSIGNETKESTDCSADYNQSFVYLLIAQINYFLLPFVLLCLLNCLILVNLFKRSRKYENVRFFNLKRTTRQCLEVKRRRKSSWKCFSIDRHRNRIEFDRDNSRSISRSICTNLPSMSRSLSSDKKCSLNRENLRLGESDTQINYHLESFRRFPTIYSNENEEKKSKRIDRDRRAARSLFILVLVFSLFLLPYVICSLLVTSSIFVYPSIVQFSFWLLWLNSTLNPFLYPFIQSKYRRSYRNLFRTFRFYFSRTNSF